MLTDGSPTASSGIGSSNSSLPINNDPNQSLYSSSEFGKLTRGWLGSVPWRVLLDRNAVNGTFPVRRLASEAPLHTPPGTTIPQ